MEIFIFSGEYQIMSDIFLFFVSEKLANDAAHS